MTTQNKPGILTGALAGLLVTAPLLALFFLANRLVGLPLVPLDFFDWLVPLIPGGLITLVIDIMVDSIIAFGGEDVDVLAKQIEQGMAFAFLIGFGVIVSAVFFAIVRRMEQWSYGVGAVLGAVTGAFFTWISVNRPFIQYNPLVGSVWVMGMFIAWGMAMGWLYRDLTMIPVGKRAAAAATDGDLPESNVEHISRREFLVRVGGATATLTVVGAGVGVLLGGEEEAATATADATTTAAGTDAAAEAVVAAERDLAFDLIPGQRPEYTPVEDHYRIDIASRPIEIDEATWTLPISGMVAENREFTLDDLKAYDPVEEIITMQCISNRLGGDLISTTRWTGVPVRTLLEEMDIEEGGEWLRIEGGDGFFEYVNIETIMNDERIMLAYFFDDEPLPERNGFPIRIYIPERYGMKQPKWIIDIQVVATDEQGYWVRRGWSEDAIMNTTSVVDVVGGNALYRDEDDNIRVPVGGWALAPLRGISKVEVSVDGGEWEEAMMREPLSDRTWAKWRYDWLFEEGTHTFEVRCYEGDGTLQPTQEQGVRPDGAAGIHSASQRLTNTLDAPSDA